jgi:hypothetical protein
MYPGWLYNNDRFLKNKPNHIDSNTCCKIVTLSLNAYFSVPQSISKYFNAQSISNTSLEIAFTAGTIFF